MLYRQNQTRLAQFVMRGVIVLALALLAGAIILAQQPGKGKEAPPTGKDKEAPRPKQPAAPKLVPAQGTASTPAPPGQEWKLAYFYDDDREVLHFADLAFLSLKRGIAVGTIVDETKEDSFKPVAMLTGDGGVTWNRMALDDIPVSLYFLDDSAGWLVTAQGIWKTEESGRSWKRVSKHRRNSIVRVWFLDNNHGFAIGAEKTVLETLDGGKVWKPVNAAAEPTGQVPTSFYDQVSFADAKHGLIIGASVPASRSGRAATARQGAGMILELETSDGGVSWKTSAAPLLGQVNGLKLNGVDGLALFSYAASAQFPSEVFHLDLQTGKSVSAFRRNDRRIMSMALFPGRRAFIAANVTRPKAPATILPAPIKILTSNDFSHWTEIDMDYRAVGTRVVLAGFDADHMWAATDTGMLLQAPAQ